MKHQSTFQSICSFFTIPTKEQRFASRYEKTIKALLLLDAFKSEKDCILWLIKFDFVLRKFGLVDLLLDSISAVVHAHAKGKIEYDDLRNSLVAWTALTNHCEPMKLKELDGPTSLIQIVEIVYENQTIEKK